jgi:hypothetical protein
VVKGTDEKEEAEEFSSDRDGEGAKRLVFLGE